ncbi:MAG: metallophosphatase family protein [Bryobacterales bacterium]|jgi:predicted phosphodiesterase|nr:metallophosphatase family protein [Bryobacterales bacterium]
MLYLLLSDLHANLEAFEAVVRDAEARYPHLDAAACLGDVVGYGADPEAVVGRIQEIAQTVIRGNHDKAVALGENLEWFNSAARDATYWTLNQLSPTSVDYLRELPRGPRMLNGFQICHGSPLDEDEYLITPGDVEILAGRLDSGVIFFGHTHVQGGFRMLRGVVSVLPRPDESDSETVEVEEQAYYILNPGSVGQPRDQDPRAAYAVYDSANRLFHMHRVAYEVEVTQRKILDAGLPERLAFRLAHGR